MPILESKGTYQGYPVQACAYRRSPGTRPDFGFVDLSIEDFKVLELKAPGGQDFPEVPWKDDTAGGFSIATFDGLRGRRTRAPGGEEAAPTPNDGLFPVGNLVLETTANGEPVPPMIYRDVYIAPGGLEEITDDLDDIVPHDKGAWRIPLTDIRAFWKYGLLAEDLNVRLDGGEFDPDTVQPNGEPWPMDIVIQFLLTLLPGSLDVEGTSLQILDGIPSPENVLGRMSPAVAAFDRVLERAGLEFTLSPENLALISQNLVEIPQGNFFVSATRLSGEIPLESYERKSITVSDRPPLVSVVGQKRIRSIEVPYIPIFQDVDGRFYPLDSVGKRWGYPLESVNKVVFVGHEKAFADIPGGLNTSQYAKNLPAGTSEGDGRLYYEKRRLAAKTFYKMYAPAHIFQGDGPGAAREGITEKELERLQFMPMHEFLDDTGERPLRLSPPQVRSFTIKQDAFKGVVRFKVGGATPSSPAGTPPGRAQEIEKIKPIEEYKKAVDQFLSDMEADIKDRERQFDELLGPTGGFTNDLADATAALLSLDATQLSEEEKRDLGKEGVVVAKDIDFSGQAIFNRTRIFIFKDDEARFNASYKRLGAILAKIQKDGDELGVARTNLQKEHDAFLKAYEFSPSIEGWLNYERGLIPSGDYSLDRNTGILIFSEVTGIMERPFVLQREDVAIFTHGFVSVRYGFEIDSNSVHDWTAVNFQIDPSSGQPIVVGYSAITGIKSHVERDPNMRSYEDSRGKPLNRAEITVAARTRARAVTRPRKTTGFVYQMAGFHRAVAVSSDVQHTFDGDAAHTIVAVSVPNAILPLGNRKLKDGNRLGNLGNEMTSIELPG